MTARDWKRAAHAGKRTLSTADEADHRKNDAAARWLAKKDKPAPSKEEMRREAERLMADYAGPVKKGLTVNIYSDGSTVRGNRSVQAITPKAKRSKRSRGKSRRLGITPSEADLSTSVDKRTRGSGEKHVSHLSGAPDISGVPTGAQTSRSAGLVIYCDGACEPNPGAGGWGFVAYRDGVEVYAESGGDLRATNNTMELTGALMALRWIAERGVVEPIRLLCDSQYVVKGCNEWRAGWKRKGWSRGVDKPLANADLWRELDHALTLVPIRLEWVKGHAGILGNERADELSLIGREQTILAAKDSDPLARQLAYSV